MKTVLVAFHALEARLAAFVATGALLRMDRDLQQIEQHETRINEMMARIDTLEEENETIFAGQDEKGEELGAEDQKTVDANLTEIKSLQGDIGRRNSQLQLLRDRVAVSARRSEAEPSKDESEEANDTTRSSSGSARTQTRSIAARRAGARQDRAEPMLRGRDLMGFKSAAHFLDDVRQSALGYQTQDLRNCALQMQRRMDANITFGEDGAFAAPPDVANDIKKKIDASADLVGLCSRWNTNSDRYTWHLDEQEPWSNTNGITGSWIDEGQTIATSSNKLTKVQTDLHKYAIAIPASSEILRSSSQLEQLIRTSAPARIAEELNSVILDGNGVGKPHGIFRSGVLAIQSKESGQTAATIVRKNVTGMHNKVHPTSRTNPAFRFVANLDVEPQLEELKGDDNRPLYLPGGGNPNLADKPFDTLRGRPLIYSPHAKALGDVGDLAGIDFSKYLVVFGENLRADFSIHVRFMSDEGVFRFIIHVGGRPMWGKKIVEPNSVQERSFAAAIQQRA
jgi:HK97 family phage major capsid protein